MGLDNSVELALTNLDLNEQVLELVTFDDGDPLEGSSSTLIDADVRSYLVDWEEDGGDSSGNGDNFNEVDIEEDY